MLDHGLVRHWLHRRCLLDQTVEQLPARAGGPAVEPKGELVEVVVEMLGAYGSLMSPHQPPLEERHHPVDAGQQLGGSSLSDRDLMAVTFAVHAEVPFPAVRVHHAAGGDGLPDKWLQARRGGVL